MLYDKLTEYTKSGVYPFHMPGHKRNISSEILPYNIDITEINDFDNLHSPQGCIKEVADKASKLFSVDYAYLLVNGATAGILSAVRAMTNYGDKVIVARNCHKSVYNAIELCGLDAIYALPEIDDGFGIFSSVKPLEIESLFITNPGVKLVILTSPTYEGVVSDIKLISEICHNYGAMLFVDEAHGAHFPFSDYFPSEAVSLGADAAVIGLHKTLPSLTQTALLLTDNNELTNKIEENLSIFESSSPSYILMSGIEKCLDYIEYNKKSFSTYTNQLAEFRAMCTKLCCLNVLCSKGDAEKNSFFDFDKSKIVISTRGTTITGTELAKILRSDFQIEIEMAYTDYIIAMTSVCDTEEGFKKLANSLLSIDKKLTQINTPESALNYCNTLPQKVFKSANRYSYKEITLPLNNAIGKIALEYLWAYPPGIPLIVPGERIDENIVNQIHHMSHSGVEVYSNSKSAPDFINTAKYD